MEDVITILETLEKTSSRNEKEKNLRNNYNNENLKKVFEYTYNPYKVYGIGEKSLIGNLNFNVFLFGTTHDTIFEILNYLIEHNTGSDVDKSKVNMFLSNKTKLEQKWYKRIILKNLRIGLTATTINKVWKDLIPTFNVQLAEPFQKMYKDVAIEVKIDGVRCIAIKRDKQVQLFTRNGKLLRGFDDIEKQIKEFPVDNKVFDGEILGKDYTDTMNNLFTKKQEKKVIYNIFDYISIDDFYAGESASNYLDRKWQLGKIINEISVNKFPNLYFINSLAVLHEPTIAVLQSYTENAVKKGFEGIMIKNVDSMYVGKRSTAWQKMKPFLSGDYKIMDFEHGTGRFENTLGKVIVDVDGVSAGVGSGFTDKQRNEIWNNKEKYLGKIIEVQYQEKVEKSGSLRFPTVKSFRSDKEV